MGIKVSNNAFGTLAAGINSSATSITLTTGQGARFPTLGAGDYFYATLVDTANNLEIVKCTARSTDVLTVVRGQETTTARSYSTGDRIEIRITAQTFLDASGIEDGEVTAAKLASGAAAGNLGFTPVDKAGDTMTGTLVVPGLTHTGWGATLDRKWDGFPSITVDNDTGLTQGEFRIHGDPGTAGGDFAINFRVDGKLLSDGVSQANAVSNATAITVATSTPTTVASATITTTGAAKPVLLVGTGDANPNQAGGWHRAAIFRNGTQVSKQIINDNSGGASANCPFAVCHIDSPGVGTHTYTLRVWQGSGSFTYGEEGDIQAPTIIAMEIL